MWRDNAALHDVAAIVGEHYVLAFWSAAALRRFFDAPSE